VLLDHLAGLEAFVSRLYLDCSSRHVSRIEIREIILLSLPPPVATLDGYRCTHDIGHGVLFLDGLPFSFLNWTGQDLCRR